MLDLFVFDDFWYLESAEQAKHMHMHMICLHEILEISEIVKIEKNNYFQIILSNFHVDVIPLRRQFRLRTKKGKVKKW